jgi:hypothetical protein
VALTTQVTCARNYMPFWRAAAAAGTVIRARHSVSWDASLSRASSSDP